MKYSNMIDNMQLRFEVPFQKGLLTILLMLFVSLPITAQMDGGGDESSFPSPIQALFKYSLIHDSESDYDYWSSTSQFNFDESVYGDVIRSDGSAYGSVDGYETALRDTTLLGKQGNYILLTPSSEAAEGATGEGTFNFDLGIRTFACYFTDKFKLHFEALSVGSEVQTMELTVISMMSMDPLISETLTIPLCSSATDWQSFDYDIPVEVLSNMDSYRVMLTANVKAGSTMAVRNMYIDYEGEYCSYTWKELNAKTQISYVIENAKNVYDGISEDYTRMRSDLNSAIEETETMLNATSIRDTTALYALFDQAEALSYLAQLTQIADEYLSSTLPDEVSEGKENYYPYTGDPEYISALDNASSIVDDPSAATAQGVVEAYNRLITATNSLDHDYITNTKELMEMIAQAEQFRDDSSLSGFEGMRKELQDAIDSAPLKQDVPASEVKAATERIEETGYAISYVLYYLDEIKADAAEAEALPNLSTEQDLQTALDAFKNLDYRVATSTQIMIAGSNLHEELALAKLSGFTFADFTPNDTLTYYNYYTDLPYKIYRDDEHRVIVLDGYSGDGSSTDFTFPSTTDLYYKGNYVTYTIVGIENTLNLVDGMSVTLPKHLMWLGPCALKGNYHYYDEPYCLSVNLPKSMEEIDVDAFHEYYSDAVLMDIYLNSDSPVKFTGEFSYEAQTVETSGIWLHVPDSQLEAYQEAVGDKFHVEATSETIVTIHDNKAGELMARVVAATDDATWKVNSVTVDGYVNQRDWNNLLMAFANLEKVDLSGAKLQGEFTFRAQTSSWNDVENNSIRNLSLAQGMDSIIVGMNHLENLTIPEGATKLASIVCANLSNICMPNSIEEIQYLTNCNKLHIEALPSSLKSLTGLNHCYNLPEELTVPEGVTYLGVNTFDDTNIKRLILPSTLQWCNPFADSDSLKDVYFCSALPPFTGSSYFTKSNAVIHVPACGEDSWRSCTQLSGSDIVTFDHLPSSINLLTTGTVHLTSADVDGYHPQIDIQRLDYNTYYSGHLGLEIDDDAQLSASSFAMSIDATFNYARRIDNPTSYYDTNGDNYGTSLLLNGKMRSDTTMVRFYTRRSTSLDEITYISLPFDVRVGDIVPPTDNATVVVMDYHPDMQTDDMKRYRLSWQTLDEDDIMQAGKGYVFYGSTHIYNESRPYIFPAYRDSKRQAIFNTDDVTVSLTASPSDYAQHRNWNFVGNPYPCYFNTASLSLSAPITIWNPYTRSYKTYAAGERYILRPGEPFFIQRPTLDGETLTFGKDGRTLDMPVYENSMNSISAKEKRSGSMAAESSRQMFKLTLSREGDSPSSDRTVIVFNDEATTSYEPGRDATKFASTEAAVQLYTLYNNSAYAVNELPATDQPIALAMEVTQDGTYTLHVSAPSETYLVDKQEGTVTAIPAAEASDDASANVTLALSAGRYTDRFYIQCGGSEPTAIAALPMSSETNSPVYNLSGQRVGDGYKGITIQNNRKNLNK